MFWAWVLAKRSCYTPARLSPLSVRLAGEPDILPHDGGLSADIVIVSRNHLAEQIAGSLWLTTKMPCPSCGILAFRCRVGSVLAQKEATTCHEC